MDLKENNSIVFVCSILSRVGLSRDDMLDQIFNLDGNNNVYAGRIASHHRAQAKDYSLDYVWISDETMKSQGSVSFSV
jgi:hypothetical protein